MKTKLLVGIVLSLIFTFAPLLASANVPFTQMHRPDYNQIDEVDDVWLTRTLDYAADYYLGSGATGDTFAVHYSPGFPVEINMAEVQFFDGGLIEVFVWDYSADAEALYPDGIAPPRGTSAVSPLGDILYGPVLFNAEGTQEWETIFGPTIVDIPSGDDFMVGFVKTAGEQPHPLADDISARGTSYTWFCGPWTVGDWGGYNTADPVTDVMMRVDVTYTGSVPPMISNLSSLPDTPNPNKPCHVTADVSDDDGVDLVFLRVQHNDCPVYLYPMSDNNIDGTWEIDFVLDGYLGDTFTYWVHAIDNTGVAIGNYDEAKSFDVVPVQNKPILFVDRGTTYVNEVQATLDDMGWQYVHWRIEDHNGVDKWLLDMGWDLVFVTGFGNATVPTREYGDDAYSEYLAAGGDMVFIDQDYFYTNGEPSSPTFGPGDFAYDFFGIEEGENDPTPAQYQFTGLTGHPISGDWSAADYILNAPDGYLWTDIFEPVNDGNQEVIFVSSWNLDSNAHTYQNSFGGNVVVFGFDPNFSYTGGFNMTGDWQTLMNNLLGYYELEFGPLCFDVVPRKTVIGTGGGLLRFDLMLENLTETYYPGMTLWWEVLRPNGMMVEGLHSEMVDLAGFVTAEWIDMTQCVPTRAPEGLYEFIAHTGYYPDIMATDSFDFYKAAPSVDLASEGDADWFGLDPSNSVTAALPTTTMLGDAYPNPFNPSTSVVLSLPSDSEVSVVVFNVMGQEVATLADGQLSAGVHTLTLNARGLASGVYFILADVPGELNQIQKVMLIQ
jgi:Secretion system C-terminal sorting domain